MNILFITSTRIGDAVLSTGILDHLICQFPDARITVACGPEAAALFEAVPNLSRVIVMEKKPFARHWLGLWAGCAPRYWSLVV
ncbi:MAG: glycosyltransferase family 9 protein, partial [Alphaproteobacteria bacterium]|nr:glycosyltransferase family 9 protein [Alphaproteobacteria bacterium]